ncbi:MAG: Clp protease ClpP [Negativicutes bacterium]|nr:Clp protease ClpP [Negativicutes bacterium]
MKKFWNFKNTAPGVGELMLYGVISSSTWWGDEITPKQFADDLAALGPVTKINVYIDSDGGDVFAGQAIRSMLKRHPANVTAYVDGVAASIASVILTAADTVIMPRNSMQMVHKPWSYVIGNADVMRKMADDLDKVAESIIAAYEEKSGMSRDEILAIMEAEQYWTAEECIKMGLADEIEQQKVIAACIDSGILMLNGRKLDFSKAKNPPKFLFLSPEPPARQPPEPEEQQPNGLLSLCEKQLQINKNAMRRY